MNNLQIKNGDIIYIRNITLEKANFIKFKPELKFLELSNPRATLEYILRSFSCLTIGDKLHFDYNQKQYILDVIDIKPKKACCIIDADIEVEFDEPDGYIEPTKSESSQDLKEIKEQTQQIDQESSSSSSKVSKESTDTKWGKLSKMAHFQGVGNKLK
jgi:ubiquitin fusion degradation protein 1